MVRLLRVVMERPRDSFAMNDTKNVWPSIELSEKYRSTRHAALRASNGSPMEPPTDNIGLPVLAASASGPATVHPLMQAESPVSIYSVLASPFSSDKRANAGNLAQMSSVRSSQHTAYSLSAPSDGAHACTRILHTGSSPTETLVESVISTKRPRQEGVDEGEPQYGRAKRANTAVPPTGLLESIRPTTVSVQLGMRPSLSGFP